MRMTWLQRREPDIRGICSVPSPRVDAGSPALKPCPVRAGRTDHRSELRPTRSCEAANFHSGYDIESRGLKRERFPGPLRP